MKKLTNRATGAIHTFLLVRRMVGRSCMSWRQFGTLNMPRMPGFGVYRRCGSRIVVVLVEGWRRR